MVKLDPWLDTAIEINSSNSLFPDDENIVRMLLDKGADIHFEHKRGYGPLHTAANYGLFFISVYLSDVIENNQWISTFKSNTAARR